MSEPRYPDVSIVAYGSLIHTPGERLAALIADEEPCVTPFSVEYGRRSRKWGHGPVLTIDPRGGPVNGRLLRLRRGTPLGVAVDALAAREGLPGAEGIVALPDPGEGVLLTCALPRNVSDRQLRPEHLARWALDSRANGESNAVSYLRDAMAVGIDTPLSRAYADRLLAETGAATLDALLDC